MSSSMMKTHDVKDDELALSSSTSAKDTMTHLPQNQRPEPSAAAAMATNSSNSNSNKHIDDHGNSSDDEDSSRSRRYYKRLCQLLETNHFLIAFILSILLARAYPPLGAVYLHPKITASWVAVVIIFFLSGLNLKSSEFKYAFKQVGFNGYIQFYNFIVVSAVVYGISRGLIAASILPPELADGMVICSCLSVSINVAIVLTKAANGDEAAAIFDAAFGNLVGVFLSPVLIAMYLQQWGDVDLVDIFYKLSMKVLVPIAIGQLLQKTCQAVVDFIEKYKKYFGRLQEYSLLFIIYTTFCKQFLAGSQNSILDIFFLILFTFIIMVIVMIGAWYSLKLLFQDKPKLRVMGLYGCTHKTISIGVPLITALYENSPNIGRYTLPLIIWYPMQVLVGTVLVPRLQAFIRNETARLAGTEADESQDDDDAEFDEDYGDDDVEIGHVHALPIEYDETNQQQSKSDSCVALPWTHAALDNKQESDVTDGEAVDVSLTEVDADSVTSSGRIAEERL
ncbi:hypothetical protein MPSEU_000323600 [Mayamaea pseudoterrestris]|nr:hypothetical protein MPSEU_000323600 [Mayamaea pseudoterrestris]